MMTGYSAVILVELLLLVITAEDAVTNRLITKEDRNRVILLSLLIGVAAVAEYIGVILNGASPSSIGLHRAVKGIEYSIAPITGVIAASAYGGVRDSRIPMALALLHAVFEWIAVPFHWVFSIDAQNVSHRESLYFIYVIAFCMSTLYVFACMIRSGKEYQTGMDRVLVLTLLLLALGIAIQFIYSEVRIDYLCIAITSYIIYNRCNKMILQVDGLTGLLNRRCYETNTRNIGSRAAILFFDVNKFKQVNDSYGHNVGDICLKNIAACLRASYGKFGTCYRIGGDEFCVILEDGLDKLDELNASFRNSIEKIRAVDHRMPNVALGYAFYDSAASHIQKVIEEADRKMYQNKRAMTEESAS